MSNLLNHFNARQQAILDAIRLLVERETTSREEARLNEIAGFVAAQFKELGGEIDFIPQPGYGTHLRARFDFEHRPASPRLLIIGHLDTVWPVGTLERMPFRVTPEGTAHGPGVFDMKSGVVIIRESLNAIQALGLQTRRPITLLLTCDEEIG